MKYKPYTLVSEKNKPLEQLNRLSEESMKKVEIKTNHSLKKTMKYNGGSYEKNINGA